ncbi:stalk domain-containing protein [Schinkia azotoformans]|uniref:stalk domain-containing protein n=1 Tax=Schinkia azotoformans TaxID=1454 RepID=UPI002E1FE115|nr:stalk domain-containing protein [Schinkia azotoformans]
MKKKMITAFLSSTLAMNVFLPNVYAKEAPKGASVTEMAGLTILVNEIPVVFDVPPVMKNDRTLVPLRAIFEAMDANVNWDEKNRAISAIKNEKNINLVIDSDVAQIEGEDHKLDVPATIYKDRTLVPLRFVGEAFGGEVVWDENTKKIKITLPDTTFQTIDAPVYVNDNKLDFGSFTRIVRNGVTFIPLQSVLDNASGELTWKQQDDGIDVQWNETKIKFVKDKNYVIVDGEQIQIANPLFDYKGTLVMPINIIPKVFGGYSHYDADTKEIFIYINQAKFKHEFLKKEEVIFKKPTNVEKASFAGNRRIMISDNPENLNDRTLPEDNVTLWHDDVQSGDAAVNHRVFGWHISELDKTATVGITIENLSSTNEIEVVDFKGTNRKTANGWVNWDVGLPLVDNVLSGKVMSVQMESPVVKAGQTALMKSFDIPKGNTLGFQYDFTVKKKSGTGELKYKIRTVLSKNGSDLASIKSKPVELDQTAKHPRGVWSSCQLTTELPPYEVGTEETAYQISNGATDNLMSQENGLGDKEQMIKNPGHFGASYLVKIPIINKTGESKTVRVSVGARGGIYNGAVKVDGKVYLIPTLKPMTELATIIDYVSEKEKGLVELEIMHAGGSALPLAIDLVTVEEKLEQIEETQELKNVQDAENNVQDPGKLAESQDVKNSQAPQEVQENVQ